MKKIIVPSSYNYIGVFLTLGCNLSCSYCINHTVGLKMQRKQLTADEWVIALNRLDFTHTLPISLQGGEPTIHNGFTNIINGVVKQTDLLTNLQFDPFKFSKNVPVTKFSRDLPYPAIRVSYHPETMTLDDVIEKAIFLNNHGYSIGIFSVDHPKYKNEIEFAKNRCKELDIFFKTKEFLGEFDNKQYGQYTYNNSCFQTKLKSCLCKTSELLIAPDGHIYRCHHDLYNEIFNIGHILDEDFVIEDSFKECSYFGNCNPCDVKIKNNRFQEFGHCSVEIKDIS